MEGEKEAANLKTRSKGMAMIEDWDLAVKIAFRIMKKERDEGKIEKFTKERLRELLYAQLSKNKADIRPLGWVHGRAGERSHFMSHSMSSG